MADGTAVRWMVSGDLKDIASIDKDCFSNPWSPRKIKRAVRSRDTWCLVAERDGLVVGYLIYMLDGQECSLERVAVAPFVRLLGIGEAMVDKLVAAMLECGCRRVETMVHEMNLPAQHFLHQIGFKATQVLREIDSDGSDWYLFEMALAVKEFQGKSRFSLEVGNEG